MCVCGQDESVKELAQDLADRLDLKTCKAYMCVQVSNVSVPGGAERTGKVTRFRHASMWLIILL